jgi:glycosyltransferase involved in cell wall biosynthesis
MTVEQLWQPVPGGSGTYVRELATALGARDDTALVGLRARHSGAPAVSWAPPPELRVVGSALPRAVLYEAWNRLRAPRSARRTGRTDVIHATTWAVPPRSAPLVVTVHDLAFLRDPSHFTRRGNAFFRRSLTNVRDEADAVIAVSATTRDDCIRAGIAPDRIHVVHHGVSTPSVTPEEVEGFRLRYRVERPYVLWCGTVEPRKNLQGLLAAYELVVASGSDLDLVLVGPAGWGDTAAAVARIAERLPSDRVHRVGELSAAELAAAYAGARLFCFPSLWEGFGMPVLEAMSHGLPVVTSRGTAMAEIGGPAAILADPLDAQEIAAAILDADARRAPLSERARAHAATFTWAACAAQTAAVYRTVARR